MVQIGEPIGELVEIPLEEHCDVCGEDREWVFPCADDSQMHRDTCADQCEPCLQDVYEHDVVLDELFDDIEKEEDE